jgi:hypothetical protein
MKVDWSQMGDQSPSTDPAKIQNLKIIFLTKKTTVLKQNDTLRRLKSP